MLCRLGAGRVRRTSLRRLYSNPPFQDDLEPVDAEMFGLEDFQHYKSADEIQQAPQQTQKAEVKPSLVDASLEERPMVFQSKLADPYTNLAIEDYIFRRMPLPEKSEEYKYNRLMFYVNSPCVVIGKNQNPWKEANVPLLRSLYIPLIRRKSGGGTVVHDKGNVNFSFMSTKSAFDRFTFVKKVVDAVNATGNADRVLQVNERGDIITRDGNTDYKVSGSAYKLAKGRSYHHGTMLLDSRLDILGKLLSTSPEKNGLVEGTSSVASVRSKVTNVGMKSTEFIECVSQAFQQHYGSNTEISEEQKEYNEMLGLEDFVQSEVKDAGVFSIEKDTELPPEVLDTANSLREWEWRFGATPKFTHKFTNEKLGITIKFMIGKHAVVEDFELTATSPEIVETFMFLRQMVDQNPKVELEQKLKYIGSDIAGFITDEKIGDWLESCI